VTAVRRCDAVKRKWREEESEQGKKGKMETLQILVVHQIKNWCMKQLPSRARSMWL